MGSYKEVLVLDLGKPDDRKIIVTTPESYTPSVYRPTMYVSWQYKECTSEYAKIRGGLACLEKPFNCKKHLPTKLEQETDSFYKYSYSSENDGLIVFVILPEGYTVHDWKAPNFTDVGNFNNRVVLIWGVIVKDEKDIGQHINSINFRLQIKKTGNRAVSEAERIKRHVVPPKKRFPSFPRDLVAQLPLLAVGPAIAAVDAIPGVTGTTLGNFLLYAGLVLLAITALLIMVVRIFDWIQK